MTIDDCQLKKVSLQQKVRTGGGGNAILEKMSMVHLVADDNNNNNATGHNF